MKSLQTLLLAASLSGGAAISHGAVVLQYEFNSFTRIDNNTRTVYEPSKNTNPAHTVTFNRQLTTWTEQPFSSSSNPEFRAENNLAARSNQTTDQVGTVAAASSITGWNTGQNFTLEGWVNLFDFMTGGAPNLFQVNGTGSIRLIFGIRSVPDEEGKLRIFARHQANSTSRLDLFSDLYFEKNEWTHLAYVVDNSRLKLYVNGVEAGSGAIGWSLGSAALTAVSIGVNLNGAFDDLRFSNVALSPEQLGYHAPFTLAPIPEPSTTALIVAGVVGLSIFRKRRNRRLANVGASV